jgi:hypothetical protein
VAEVYRDIMQWPEFRHPRVVVRELDHDVETVELLWRSSEDAHGMELMTHGSPRLDLRASYWHEAILVDGAGTERYTYGESSTVELPHGTERVTLFAPPPDGRDNSPDGYRASVPVPKLA